ncbi:MAG TPA: hypothetical protein VFU15_15310 [Bacteroidia bacterium]|nr:hypothetical protein [Bacteroidia bacterium]
MQMNIYTTQLKKSIRQKLEHINDTEYLASLDAILTFETISPDGKMPRQESTQKRSLLKKMFSLL